MKNDNFAHVIRFIGALITAVILGALILGFTGCKAVEKYKDSDKFAEDCADKFPVKVDSIYIEGETKTDTVLTYNYGVDTVTIIKDGGTVTKYVYLDRIVNKTVTICKTDTIRQYIENTARIAALKAEIATLKATLSTWQAKAKKRGKQALIAFSLLSAILVYSGWKVWGNVKGKLKA